MAVAVDCHMVELCQEELVDSETGKGIIFHHWKIAMADRTSEGNQHGTHPRKKISLADSVLRNTSAEGSTEPSPLAQIDGAVVVAWVLVVTTHCY